MRSKDFSVSKEEFNIVKCVNLWISLYKPRPDNNELSKYYISDHYISHNN